jgi:glucose/arabinose dehydrogenase
VQPSSILSESMIMSRTPLPHHRAAIPDLRTARAHGARLAVTAVLTLALLACGTEDEPVPLAPGLSPTAPPAASPAPTGPPSPDIVSPTSPPDAAGDRPDLDELADRLVLAPVAAGFEAPLHVTHAGDGSGRLFVVEQAGRIRVVRDGAVLPEPFLDIADRVTAGGERGLLGLAFPPGFGSEHDELFVHYSDRSGDTTLSAFTVPSTSSDVADPGSERVILRVAQPYPNHNGGAILFDDDGMLLLALGDGGAGGDPENRAERVDNLLGKILRIDVLGGAVDGEAYGIPDDNPFAGRADARPEILHYGLRNPWRVSLDRSTGDLWIGDVGQNRWEEVNVARAGERGLDFGWNTLEGRHCFDPPQGCDPAGTRLPVAEYAHDQGCSVTGGYVYRGEGIPALRGAYVFSDYCSGLVFAIDAAGPDQQVPVTLLETDRRVGSLGLDEAGELYLVDLAGGELLRFEPAPG